MKTLVELQSVSRRFGERSALQDISLKVHQGERLLILGESGSGKSTLLRLISGALKPSEGRVLVEGEDLGRMSSSRLRAYRLRLGLVQQAGALVSSARVHHNVTAGLLGHRSSWASLLDLLFWTQRARVATALKAVGLEGRQWDRLRTLSGGQQQRVAIARALIRSPSLMIADEPTAALDPKTASRVLELLVQLSPTMVLSTHAAERALKVVDRVIGLSVGRLVFDLPAEAVDSARLEALYEGPDERL